MFLAEYEVSDRQHSAYTIAPTSAAPTAPTATPMPTPSMSVKSGLVGAAVGVGVGATDGDAVGVSVASVTYVTQVLHAKVLLQPVYREQCGHWTSTEKAVHPVLA